MAIEILPDSRLKTTKQTIMGDFDLPSGGTVRIEWEMAYCFICGKPYAWVPKENTVSCHALCNRCFKEKNLVAAEFVMSDDEFCKNVVAEMESRFGRTLTDEELYLADRDHNLGPALEALVRDSPYPSRDNRTNR